MKKFLSVFTLLLSVLLLSPVSVFADGIEDLSLEEILGKYSLITLGQRDNGNVTLFHLTGNYLVNGTINKVIVRTEGKGTDAPESACTSEPSKYFKHDSTHHNGFDIPACSTLNFSFENLYNNIVAAQAEIERGVPIEGESILELTPGSNYNIVNINDVKEILFKDIDSEENNLTIITVLDSGSVHMPSVYWIGSNEEKYQFITNDFFGGETAYNANADEEVSPQNNEVVNYNASSGYNIHNVMPRFYKYEEVYHGNIVWNFPNATSIDFTGVPFVGHLIAPNADVSMPESNTAGAIIANSFTSEGGSEIHKYTLQKTGLLRDLNSRNETVSLDCDCETGDTRPNSVTIYLAANGERIRSVVLTRENNYAFELTDLPATLDGRTEIVYTLEGDYIDEYVKGISDFNLMSGCENPTDDVDEEEPTEDTTEEPTTNSTEDIKKEENPVTGDKVPYIMFISLFALTVLFASTQSLNNKKHEKIIRK